VKLWTTVKAVICTVIFIALSGFLGLAYSSGLPQAQDAVASYFLNDNLREVSPGRFYRSGKLEREKLRSLIKRLNIKTVVNLRLGKDSPDESGLLEKEVTEAAGAVYTHIPLNGREFPSPERIQMLLDVFDRGEEPFLVHCTSGTHRSGIASALWLHDKEKLPLQLALEQLTILYGFIKTERMLKNRFGRPTADKFIWMYKERHEQSGIDFRTWLHGDYAASYVPAPVIIPPDFEPIGIPKPNAKNSLTLNNSSSLETAIAND
jgi:protein tyrosine phosphatase (PTP) superfamily phosphohydrolase (DUF442 family)